ncbi:TniB family NTP-binding protein [Mycolicibacter heraklionensis]|uniref:TniB family NTP-binding protein n=1 Tax=Mycolicibacter heraklionensis TaxID=512402 RepID=UPI0007F03BBD|nr:TniB family NTP-binding protein [Mycolicibacter heraklionensis]OBJ33702.1 AAA family ATPase [Mycolicibacter heraklionensis]
MTTNRANSAQQSTLDNLTLSRKEGFFAFADAAALPQPERLTRTGLKGLSESALADYNARRRVWHANLGPLRTPQLADLHEQLWDIVDSNVQTGDKPKSAVAIDGFPGLGKTTAALAFARDFHRREIAEGGPETAEGHQRIPVCRVGLTGNTGMLDFNRAMLAYFGHPGTKRGTAAQLAHRALDCVLTCQTRLLMIDDLHFLRWRNTQGVEISNHFKYIANEFPVTIIYIGVGLSKRGLFSEGSTYQDPIIAQTGRRTTKLTMDSFAVKKPADRKRWRALLLSLEKRIVLADSHPGMLADELSDYLYARSTGHIGSLITLVNRACQRAVRTGTERLTQDLLDRVKNDEASEKARQGLQSSLRAGKLTTRISKRAS